MTSPRRTWAERIEAAKKRGKFTGWDERAAQRWGTCAVGEATKGMAPATSGPEWVKFLMAPREGTDFCRLGMHFQWHVRYNQLAEASRLYDRIQALAKRKRAK